MGFLEEKKKTQQGGVGGGSDRLHELTVRYKAVQAGAGSGEGTLGVRAADLPGCRGGTPDPVACAWRREGTRGLATQPLFAPRYEPSEAISPRERSH